VGGEVGGWVLCAVCGCVRVGIGVGVVVCVCAHASGNYGGSDRMSGRY
jgi:hypothetical protein